MRESAVSICEATCTEPALPGLRDDEHVGSLARAIGEVLVVFGDLDQELRLQADRHRHVFGPAPPGHDEQRHRQKPAEQAPSRAASRAPEPRGRGPVHEIFGCLFSHAQLGNTPSCTVYRSKGSTSRSSSGSDSIR